MLFIVYILNGAQFGAQKYNFFLTYANFFAFYLLISKKMCTFAAQMKKITPIRSCISFCILHLASWMKPVHLSRATAQFCILHSAFCILIASCTSPTVPRPYGYFRIAIPDTAYEAYQGADFRFDLSTNATVKSVPEGFNIHYPTLNADIHCTYKPVDHNLRELTDDALEFVYKHVNKASAIPEKSFVNDEQQVYGVFFELEGNTASPYQFFLTDSTDHFFRGAAYCYCQPNADSLAPVLHYIKDDIIHLIETFQWNYATTRATH